MSVSATTIDGISEKMDASPLEWVQETAVTGQLHFVISAQSWQTAAAKKLKELAQQTQIPGFRPGKPIPDSILMKRFGEKAISMALQSLLEEGVERLVKKYSLHLAVSPRIQLGADVPFDAPLAHLPDMPVTAACEYWTDVLAHLKQLLSQVQLEKPQFAWGDAEIEKMRQDLLQANGEWKLKETAAQYGDRVLCDCSFHRLPAEGAEPHAEVYAALPVLKSEKNAYLVCEAANASSSLPFSVLGYQKGEQHAFTVEANEAHASAFDSTDAPVKPGDKLAVLVTVHQVEELELPEWGDAFVQRVSQGRTETADALIETMREHLTQTAEEQALNAMQRQLIAFLEKVDDLPIPPSVLNEQRKRLASEPTEEHAAHAQTEADHQHGPGCQHEHENASHPHTDGPDKAAQIVRYRVLLDAYESAHGITVSEEYALQLLRENMQHIIPPAYYNDPFKWLETDLGKRLWNMLLQQGLEHLVLRHMLQHSIDAETQIQPGSQEPIWGTPQSDISSDSGELPA